MLQRLCSGMLTGCVADSLSNDLQLCLFNVMKR